ncbi:MAG: hypothetical protein NDI75_04785 [Candidatus Didemnitutus sp.]|nr:hypothetical protein [Candidatus Didemnitutus sp.]
MLALAASTVSGGAATVFIERFTDGERATPALPASLAWHASHTTGIVSVAAGELTLSTLGTDGSAARSLGAHFPRVQLENGQALVLTFDFACRGDLGGSGVAFRAGVFDSLDLSANRFTQDGGNVHNAGNSSRGYAVNLNPAYVPAASLGAPTLEWVERTGIHRFLTSSTAFARLAFAGPFSNEQTIAPQVRHSARLRLDRRGEAVHLRAEIWSAGMPALLVCETVDASAAVSGFDTIGFSVFEHATTGGMSEVTLSNLRLVHVDSLTHGLAYYAPGTFAAWPANEGAWAWGEEMLVCFNVAPWTEDSETLHHYVPPLSVVFARSHDGGATWQPEMHPEVKPQADVPGSAILSPVTALDFSHPDFALKLRGQILYASTDRGQSWTPPYRIPALLDANVRARTSYLPLSDHEALWFLMSTATNDDWGRSYVVRATSDGDSTTTAFLSQIGDDPGTYPGALAGSSAVMPSAVRIGNRCVAAIRKRYRFQQNGSTRDLKWTDLYESSDEAASWTFLGQLESGAHNPVTLVALGGAKIAAVYCSRRNSQSDLGLRAKLSDDGGRTWSPEIRLRDDALNTDIGYTRVLPRDDGGLAILYYYCTPRRPEQHIARTIWYPATGPAPQEIEFDAIADRPFAAEAIPLVATASSGLSVALQVISGPAHIEEDTLVVTSPGVVTVRATQPGNDVYLPATPVERTFVATTSFAFWRSEHWNSSELAEPLLSGADADPDGDARSNLLEYALGSAPRSADADAGTTPQREPEGWSCSFRRPRDRADVTYAAEFSSDLEHWDASDVALERVSVSAQSELWRASVITASHTGFFRLRISLAP